MFLNFRPYGMSIHGAANRTVITVSLAAAFVLCVLATPFWLLARTFPSAPTLIVVPGARTAHLSEGTIRFEDEGAGEHAVLLLHGFNGQLGYWDAAWQAMDACPRKVRVDIPGFGGSAFDVSRYDLQ